MNAVCPECDLEYAMKQEALDRLGCMYCPWSGAQEKRPGDLRQDTNRTAPTETPIERNSVMSDSTTRRAEQDHSDEPPQVKDALNRWAEGKATFGDLMLASQDAGVDPGPVMQKAMRSTFTEEQLEFLQQEGDQ